MNHVDALRANRAEALALGVQGSTPEANAERAQRARDIIAEQATKAEAAAGSRTLVSDRDTSMPFATRLVARHGGNLDAVLASTEFTRALDADMQRERPADWDANPNGWAKFQARDTEHEHIREQLVSVDAAQPRVWDWVDHSDSPIETQEDPPASRSSHEAAAAAVTPATDTSHAAALAAAKPGSSTSHAAALAAAKPASSASHEAALAAAGGAGRPAHPDAALNPAQTRAKLARSSKA